MRGYTIHFPKEVVEVLSRIEMEALPRYSEEDIQLFYGDWRRRVELLCDMAHLASRGDVILDAGSAPGFTSLALKLLGHEVYSLDVNPEPYRALLEEYGVKIIKADLESEVIPLGDEHVECAVFTEVLEHLHPYKISFTLSEINRVLEPNGLLYLTTPNAASIGKRARLAFGLQPVGKMHVREYTKNEVQQLLIRHGFKLVNVKYSFAYNLTPHDAKGKDFANNLFVATLKYPSKNNVFHIITCPLVFIIPQLRATQVIMAMKERYIEPQTCKRFY